ncbi:MAG TPA: Crp/Fnr family transcriptional regulator [Arenibacter sp.]|nr:Crp/Fnr family transcriptional regulator [Arenibacter sp.]
MDINNTHFLRCLEALKDSLFFNKMDADTLKEVLPYMTRCIWTKGTFRNGNEVASHLHFIISGRLKMYQVSPSSGRERTIMILTKGDVFDIMCLMDSEAHDIYYEAMDELEILFLSKGYMHKWILKNPSMNSSIYAYLGKRFRELEEVASNVALNNTLVRLSNLLLRNVNDKSKELEVINNLPNNEIASLIGTTRAVVNRHIQELKNYGAISVSRKYIHIDNPEVLRSISRETFVGYL